MPSEPVAPNFVFRDMIPVGIIDWDGTAPGTRVSNLGDFLWAFVHPAVCGEGKPAARMVRAAADEYGATGPEIVDAMLGAVRGFASANPEVAWGHDELAYMERNAELFAASLR